MTEPRDDVNGSDDTFDELFADYVDRLVSGEVLDLKRIAGDHPDVAGDLVERLRVYGNLVQQGSAATPLGTLGDYTLRRQIGRGGMGVVYEAWENSMGRAVALKVLPAGVAADEKALQRFVREAQVAGDLHHPNVVPVYGMGLKEKTPYYSMEYVEGETLAEILTRIRDAEAETETPFGPKDQVDYFAKLARAFADVADGLQHAHSKGVIHRDIKPSNLILDGDGRLRILDFGLARLEGQESLTLSGDFVGTPLYMSPEQARRKKIPVDHRTDVYSLGATMYEALTGRPPFRGKDHADTLSQIIERDPVELRKVNSRVPKDLETIVLKCLRKDTADRYGTAEALAQDLQRFTRGHPIEARSLSQAAKLARRVRRHRRALGAAFVVLVLTVSAIWLGVERAREARLGKLKDYERAVEKVLVAIYADSALDWLAAEQEFLLGSGLTPVSRDELRSFSALRQTQVVADAVDVLRAVTKLRPGDASAPFHLARAYRFLGESQRAEEAFRAAFARDPRFVPARVLRLELAGQPPSETELQRIASTLTDPESWQARWLDAYRELVRARDRATAQRPIDRWTPAISALSRLLELKGTIEEPAVGLFLEAHIARGLARLSAFDFELAHDDLLIAKDRAPVFELKLLAARAKHLSGRSEDAAEELERLHRIAAEREEQTALWIAAVYDALAAPEQGLQWARKLSQNVSLKRRVESYFLYRLGHLDKAIAVAREATLLSPSDAHAHLILAASLGESLACSPIPERRVTGEFLDAVDAASRLRPDLAYVRQLQAAAAAAAAELARSVRGAELAPRGRFARPVKLRGPVNSAVFEYYPVISADGRTLYFTARYERGGFGNEDIWVATRERPEDAFGRVVNFQELAAPGIRLNSRARDHFAWPTSDQLEVYFSSEAGGDSDIFRASRPGPSLPFDRVERLGPQVNSPDVDSCPSLTADGLILYFYRRKGWGHPTDIWTAERASRDEPFGQAHRVEELAGPDHEFAPRISADGLTLFFSDWLRRRCRDGGRGEEDLWVAQRASRSAPFGPAVNLNDMWPGTHINTPGGQGSVSPSPDWPAPGSKLYFAAWNLPGGFGDNGEIWVATWIGGSERPAAESLEPSSREFGPFDQGRIPRAREGPEARTSKAR